MHRLRTVTSLDVSAVAGHHAMLAALLFGYLSWLGCSKLTTLLVNVLLIQTLISEICQFFFFKKCEKLFSFFSIKNISVFCNIGVKHLTS